MQLTKYDPFRELRQLSKDFEDQWSENKSFFTLPALDVFEEDGKLIVETALPNFKKEDIKVAIDNGALMITAVRHSESRRNKPDSKRRYYVHESESHYSRRIALPDGVNASQVEAEFKDGTLRVSMPVSAARQPAIIDIK